jgi:hypothetical protein
MCDSTCYIHGGHIQTFDGAGLYFNGGDCTYSMVEPSKTNDNLNANIRITIGTNSDISDVNYDSQYLLQPRVLTVTFKEQIVKLTATRSGLCSEVSVEINGKNSKNVYVLKLCNS